MALSNNVLLLLVVLMTVINWQAANALRADMKRVDSSNMTSSQRLHAAVLRSNARLRRIGSSVRGAAAFMSMDVDAPVNRGNNLSEFLITMAIGTPPRKMVAMLDTGITTDILSNETLTLWDTSGNQQSFAGITFGCSHDTPRGDGFSEADDVFGLVRGSLSFVSQMGSSVGSRFSYCLTSFMDDSPSDSSPLLFGTVANLTETIRVQSTPMIENIIRKDLNTLYYISVMSIGVGQKMVFVPKGTFDIQQDGSGGFIIDSGSAVSYLTPAAFTGVAKAIDSVVKWDRADGSDYGFSLCYHVPQGNDSNGFPDISFIFEGGAEYVVDQKYNFRLVNKTSGLVCVLILEMDEAMAAASPSILGNYHQQNYHILYDNDNQMLSFVRASCASLSQPAFDQTFSDAQSPKPANTQSSAHVNAVNYG
ncbi:aspartic proteinase nepenthesin-2-like [Cryptomeria japonica]|uniref:aspartic proteinase nepenthesin-2-like n=1 Tax=Cryptomeria japonica TaxID=3369 RepID=UPI0027DA3A54|nr:aspartic proteinase nepenthesin-2-like [Cryptomeria japonica]